MASSMNRSEQRRRQRQSMKTDTSDHGSPHSAAQTRDIRPQLASALRALAASGPDANPSVTRQLHALIGEMQHPGRAHTSTTAPTPSGPSLQRLALNALSKLSDPRSVGGRSPGDAAEQRARRTGHELLPDVIVDLLRSLAPERPQAPAPGTLEALTVDLLGRLAPAVGLAPASVDVRLDARASARAQSRGARALFEGGAIYLDRARFDPSSRDGTALLAHEVTHAAQARYGRDTRLGARGAELEATATALDLSQGRSVQRPSAALPAGYVALEGGEGVSLAEIQRLRQQLQAQLGPAQEQIKAQTPPTAPGGQLQKPVEDPSEKVDRYEGGVDGIADEIGDLAAFDALIDAIDDDEPTQPALDRVRRTEPYQQLCDMWQGAQEGGAQKPQMVRAFGEQFNGRGFWGETEQAFNMVCAASKRDAKLNAAAKAAKADLAAAQGKDVSAVTPATSAPATTAAAGPSEGAPAPKKTAREKAMEKAMGMKVESAEPPKLAAFDQAEQMHGGPKDSNSLFAAVGEEYGHYQSNAGAAQKVASEGHLNRSGQIWGEAFKGLAAGGTKGFIEQFTDTMVLDTLGTLGDLGLKAATKGRLGSKVPVIGPAIQLFQSGLVGDVFSGEIFKGRGQFIGGLQQNMAKVGEEFGAGGKNLSKAWEAGFSADGVGFLCAGIADLVSGIADIIDTVAQVMGVLSALSYILGAILICAGLALVWLAGIGAPLITAGGWLVRAGNVLGKIVTALGPIVIVFKAIATLFRIAAAYMVPAEAYAEQLSGVGKNAESFGEKAGGRAGDKTAGKLKGHVAAKIETHSQKKQAAADQAAELGHGKGDADAAAIKAKSDEADLAAKQLADEATTQKAEHDDVDAAAAKKQQADEAARAKQGEDADAAKKAADPAKKPGEGPDAAPKKSSSAKAKQAYRAAKDLFVGDFMGSWRELGAASKEMWGLTTNAKKAREAVSEMLVDVAPERAEHYKTQLEKLVAARDELSASLGAADTAATQSAAKLQAAQTALAAAKAESAAPESGAPGGAVDRLKLAAAKAEATQAAKDARAAQKELTRIQKTLDTLKGKIDRRQEQVDYEGGLVDRNARAKAMNPDEREQLKAARDEADAAALDAHAVDRKAQAKSKKAGDAKDHAEGEAARVKKAHDEVAAAKTAAEEAATKLTTDIATAKATAKTLRDRAQAAAEQARELTRKSEKAQAEAKDLTRQQGKLNDEAAALRERVAASKAAEEALPGAKEALAGHNKEADTRRRASREAQDKADAAFAAARHAALDLGPLYGKPIEFAAKGDGQPATGEFVRASAEGVIVRDGPGGTRKTVPWADITGPQSLVDAGKSIVKSQTEGEQHKATAEAESTAAKTAETAARTQSNQVWDHEVAFNKARPDERDGMLHEADTKAQKANGELAASLAAAQKIADAPIQNDVASLEAAAASLKAQSETQTGTAAELSFQLTKKREEVRALEAQVREKANEHKDLEKKAEEARTAATSAKTAADGTADAATAADGKAATAKADHDKDADAEDLFALQQTLGNSREDQAFWARVFRNPSSGNAMGGVGSTYKEFLEKLESGEVFDAFLGLTDRDAYNANEERKAAEEKAAVSPTVQDSRNTVLKTDAAREAEEAKRKSELSWSKTALELWGERGKAPAAWLTKELGGPLLGDLLLEAPPKDPADMGATFARAQDAMEASVAHHAKAHEAWVAEEQVTLLIDDEINLQKAVGDQVRADAEAQKAPIQAGKQKEKERKGKVKEKQAQDKAKMDNSLVSGLAEKVMKNSKYLSSSPNPGLTRSAGTNSESAQDDAHTSTKNAAATSVDSSDQQAAFLQGLEDSQGKIVAYLVANQAKLDQKIEADKAERTEIQKHKAQNLVTSREKRMEAEQESLRFMVDMNDAVGWAAKYKQKRVSAAGN